MNSGTETAQILLGNIEADLQAASDYWEDDDMDGVRFSIRGAVTMMAGFQRLLGESVVVGIGPIHEFSFVQSAGSLNNELEILFGNVRKPNCERALFTALHADALDRVRSLRTRTAVTDLIEFPARRSA
jgi:hypothetical protein